MFEIITKKILDDKMRRRDFLERAARTAGIISIGSIPIINSACKKDTPTTPAGPEPPVPVTLQFEVYNHTEGYRTSFTRNTMSEQNVNIKISDLGYNDVDPYRIVVREKNMGPLANFGRTGEANFIAPRQNMSYDVFLMNKSNGTKYELVDNNGGNDGIVPARLAGWMREDWDGKTGPEDAIEYVVAQFNRALNPSFMSYGSLNRVSSGGDVKIGYGLCLWNGEPVGGMHSVGQNSCQIWVNAEVCQATGRDIRGVFVTELFEALIYVGDIHGNGSLVNEQDRYLSVEGQELLRYVYAKDDATRSSGSKTKFSFGFK